MSRGASSRRLLAAVALGPLLCLASCGGKTREQIERATPMAPAAKPEPSSADEPDMPPAEEQPPVDVRPPDDSEPPDDPEPPVELEPLPVPLCAGDAPFGEPVPVAGIDPALSIEGAWLSEDGLELVVSARNDDANLLDFDLQMARRDPITVEFGALAPLVELNTASLERKPVLTDDGLTIFFESDRAGTGSDIYLAERQSGSEPFGEPRVATAVSSKRNDVPGDFSAVSNILYFSADRLGGPGQENVYQAARRADGSFEEVFLVSSVDSDGSNIAPAISSDDLTIYLSSNRDNKVDASLDVYRAQRHQRGNAFPEPRPVAELNSDGSDVVAWVSFDECTLLLTRETAPGSAQFTLLVAER